MSRFRRKNDPKQNRDEDSPARRPMREYVDESHDTPPSMLFFRLEVTAYWLLPLLAFCLILGGGIYLAFKFDIIRIGSEEAGRQLSYLGPSGEILVPELLESYVEAAGGRTALLGIRSARYKGRIREASGEFDFQVLKLPPDKGMIMINPGGAASQRLVLNNDIGWQVIALADGSQRVVPMSDENVASLAWSLQLHNTFRRIALEGGDPGFSVQEIEFEGRPSYQLTKTMPDGSELVAVLDAEELLLVKTIESAPGIAGDDRLTVVYSDHRSVAGIIEAYRTKTSRGDGGFYNEITLESIEIDPGLMSVLFEVPAELLEPELSEP